MAPTVPSSEFGRGEQIGKLIGDITAARLDIGEIKSDMRRVFDKLDALQGADLTDHGRIAADRREYVESQFRRMCLECDTARLIRDKLSELRGLSMGWRLGMTVAYAVVTVGGIVLAQNVFGVLK